MLCNSTLYRLGKACGTRHNGWDGMAGYVTTKHVLNMSALMTVTSSTQRTKCIHCHAHIKIKALSRDWGLTGRAATAMAH